MGVGVVPARALPLSLIHIYQVNVRQTADPFHEAPNPDQFAEDQSGVVKTQGLIKITHE